MEDDVEEQKVVENNRESVESNFNNKQRITMTTTARDDEVDGNIIRICQQISMTPEEIIKQEFSNIFVNLRLRLEGEDDVHTVWGKVKQIGQTVLSTLNVYVQRVPVRTDVKDGKICIDCLIRWASNLEEGEDQRMKIVCDQDSLVRILEDKKQELPDEYMSEEEFVELVLCFHRSCSEKLRNHEKILRALAFADMVKWWPPRLCIIIISSLDIGLFLYAKAMEIPTPNICSQYILNPHRHGEGYRYLTYGFLHASWNHLLSNLMGQILIGIPLEFSNRWWRVLLVYVSGVLAGSLFQYIIHPNMFLVGASAGVYALITAHLSTIILNWKEDDTVLSRSWTQHNQIRAIKTKEVRFIRIFIVLLYVIIDISSYIYHKLYPDMKTNVSHTAHISGAAAGLLAAIIIFNNRKKDRWQSFLRRFLVGIIVLSLFISIIFNFFGAGWFPDHFPKQQHMSWIKYAKCCEAYSSGSTCKAIPTYCFSSDETCYDDDDIPSHSCCNGDEICCHFMKINLTSTV